MHIKKINIKNFRGIKHLSLELDELTVLIGENNTGKTSILEALRTCLSRSLTRKASPFSDFDYHLQDANTYPTQAKQPEAHLHPSAIRSIALKRNENTQFRNKSKKLSINP
jgi:putative ATP-dependent endonuclease of OLD family